MTKQTAGSGHRNATSRQLGFRGAVSKGQALGAGVRLVRECFPAAENSMDFKGLKTLFSCSFDDWNNYNAPRMGAALAFYTVASISPLVILVLGVVSLVFNKNAAEAKL